MTYNNLLAHATIILEKNINVPIGNKHKEPFVTFFVDEDKWKTEARTEGGAIQEYTISYQNLVPATSYTFRVIAYNKYGISYPAKSQSSVRYVHLSSSYFEGIRSIS